jgi:hypothetical protein
LRGSTEETSKLTTSTGANPGVSYTGSGTPETDWGRFFFIENLLILHTGSASALRFDHCLNFRLQDVMTKGSSATSHGIEFVDCYAVVLTNVRSHTFGASAIRVETTGITQPGQLIFNGCAGRTSNIGFDIVATSGVLDSCSFNDCIATDNTSYGVKLSGSGGIRNFRFTGIHLEHSSTSNACVGLYQTGVDCLNLVVDGAFCWGLKTPFNISGTVTGLQLENVYLNKNGHTAENTAITVSSNVSRFELGSIVNPVSGGYTTLLSDSSDSTTARKRFAGALPQAVQASSTLTLSQTSTDITGATFTATPMLTETWIVMAVFDFNCSATDPGLCVGTIDFDGSSVGGNAFFDPDTTGRGTVSTVHVIGSVSAGTSHTVKLKANKSNAGGTATASAAHTRFVIYRVQG